MGILKQDIKAQSDWITKAFAADALSLIIRLKVL